MSEESSYRIVRCRRKTVALQVTDDLEVVVRAPNYVSSFFITKFVKENISWIEKRKKEVVKRKALKKNFTESERFFFLGETHPLSKKHQGKSLKFKDGVFCMGEGVIEPEKVFEKWYKKQAKEILAKRTQELADMYGFTYHTLRITSARTRWGSCNSDGGINLSWRLILAYKEAIDYVILHELVHTKHMNHSKSFWNAVAEVIPEYKRHKKWLNENPMKEYFG